MPAVEARDQTKQADLVRDRSFTAFLRAVRSEPGFGLRVASTLAFGLGLLIAKGVVAVLLALAAAVGLGLAIGYPYFRARGRLLGGSRR